MEKEIFIATVALMVNDKVVPIREYVCNQLDILYETPEIQKLVAEYNKSWQWVVSAFGYGSVSGYERDRMRMCSDAFALLVYDEWWHEYHAVHKELSVVGA